MLKKLKLILFILLIAFIIILLKPTNVFASTTDEMKIYSINLGEGNNGDSTLVESNGEHLLMDIGVRQSYDTIDAFLTNLGVQNLSLYLSHFHGDHTGEFKEEEGEFAPLRKLMQKYKINHIYLPDPSLLKYKGEQVEEWEATYYNKIRDFYNSSTIQTEDYDDVLVYLNSTGENGAVNNFSFGAVNVSVIGPVGMDNFTSPLKKGKTVICPENTDEDLLDDYQNNCSLVSKLVCGNVSFLTAGDLKTDGEKALIKKYKGTDTLKATIYKMSHHGLYPANGEEFMSYVKPDFSFVSNYAHAGLGNTGYWEIRTAQKNCSDYGFVYMGGQENKTLKINVEDNNISLYKYGKTDKLNAAGWTKVKGGEGTNRTYDYYYFGSNGYTIKGVQKIDGKYYYLGTGGYRHYGNGKGTSYIGMRLCTEDNKKRYFNESDDSMLVGVNRIKDASSDGLYYFKKDGSLVVSSNGGWQKKKLGDYYYSVYTSGKLSESTFREYDGGMCYFDSKGKMLTGWQTIDGEKYYLNKKTGVRYTGFKKIGDDYYLFSDYGRMQKGGFKKLGNGYCYLASDGKALLGWQTISGKKYYFSKSTGKRLTGFKKIGNKYYFFSDYGVLQTNTTKVIGGVKYKFGSSGAMTNVPVAKKPSISSLSSKKTSITVKWSKKSVDGYQVFISTSSDGKYKKVATIKKGSTTSTTIKDLKKGTKYYIKIRSYKKVGSYKEYSKYSGVKNIKTKK